MTSQFTAFQGGSLPEQFAIDTEYDKWTDELEQREVLTATVLNRKTSGVFNTVESYCYDNYFTSSNNIVFRPIYRVVVNFGALPNNTTKSVAHGVSITQLVRAYGAATNPSTSFIPIPYTTVAAVANNVQLSVDGTNVSIRTESNMTAYTLCTVVLEYTK